MAKYTLTPEHRAQLKPWADKWIANAMSTKPMDDADRQAMVAAIEGLYEAAGLKPPPKHRIVFVPSPFVLRFAGGFAAAIWWLRSRDATDAATRAATAAATDAATRAATRAATDAATDAATWYAGLGDYLAVAKAFGLNIRLAANCALYTSRMLNGGNQWSGWVAWLSFFREVVKLALPIYEKWQHYEAASIHGGPRIVHKEFCMISDRPRVLKVDKENRPHCEDGPFCRWSDDTRLYAWHGVRVPWDIIETPEVLTKGRILGETNAEVRRVMIEKLGNEEFLKRVGATPIQEDSRGRLFRIELAGDEPMLAVQVINSTPEPDGHHKLYMLRVHPDLRPMLPDGKLGKPQALTATNAIASTFGMTGEDYEPAIES
jgi:hypothetical protein